MAKLKGAERRTGKTDRRSPGKWATHLWGILLLFAIMAAGSGGYHFGRGEADVGRAQQQAATADSARAAAIMDSLVALAQRQPETVERVVVRDRIVRDTVEVERIVEVAVEPQIIRSVDTIQVLVMDTVTIYAAPEIYQIPPEKLSFWSTRHAAPNVWNILYAVGGVALGTILGSDASACIVVTTAGGVERTCDPDDGR